MTRESNLKKYGVLVVDPPWAYGADTGRTRCAETHYKTIGSGGKEINRKSGAGIENIISETPVCELADDNAHLYLWTTNPKLPFAFKCVIDWGFEYKTMLTWVKSAASGEPRKNGMGFFFRGATEHVLFAVKGRKPIVPAMRKPNVFLAKTGAHSEKPAEFYELLRSIYPDAEQMIDMYARRRHARFDAWGDQAESEPEIVVVSDPSEFKLEPTP